MTQRLATICLMTMFLIGVRSPSIQAQDNDFSRATLKGISAVFVEIEPLPDSGKTLGLTAETIQTDVELKLRLAGIRVVTPEEGYKLPGSPYVYVILTLTPNANAAYINVQLVQNVLLERNGEHVYGVPTWDTGYIMPVPTSQRIRDTIKDKVDVFLNAWLSVNPKK
jgi:hypothetical protein